LLEKLQEDDSFAFFGEARLLLLFVLSSDVLWLLDDSCSFDSWLSSNAAALFGVIKDLLEI
jgi:hypothetical protein